MKKTLKTLFAMIISGTMVFSSAAFPNTAFAAAQDTGALQQEAAEIGSGSTELTGATSLTSEKENAGNIDGDAQEVFRAAEPAKDAAAERESGAAAEQKSDTAAEQKRDAAAAPEGDAAANPEGAETNVSAEDETAGQERRDANADSEASDPETSDPDAGKPQDPDASDAEGAGDELLSEEDVITDEEEAGEQEEKEETEEESEEDKEDEKILDAAAYTFTSANTLISGVSSQFYTGKEITFPISVYFANSGQFVKLKKNVDYTLTYANNINAGTATVTVTGMGSYSGSVGKTFKIKKIAISALKLKYPEMAYNGTHRTQNNTIQVTAVSGTTTIKLKYGQDFTASYKDNLNIGTATVTIKGKGNFKGKLTQTFMIVPATTSITGLTVGNEKITVKWDRREVNTTGYQLQYSLKKDFSSAKTVTFSKNTTLKKTVSNLRTGRTYYFRIRVYFDWFGTRYLSKWSDVKKKKTAVKLTISGSDGKRTLKVINADESCHTISAAMWTVAGNQDDLKWVSLNKQSDGSWQTTTSVMDMNRTGSCIVHAYGDGMFLDDRAFDIKADENFLGVYLQGEDSRIDFVQCAVNIAADDNIGYGHTWPETISCSGLVGLTLTYCGYADFIQNDPLGWGYIGIGNSFENNLVNSLGCKKISGTFNSSNYKLLKAGDILLYDNEFGCHVGIYVGNGYTVEARGPEGSSSADDNGWEVAVYNWRTDVVQYDTVYRIPSNRLQYRW